MGVYSYANSTKKEVRELLTGLGIKPGQARPCLEVPHVRERPELRVRRQHRRRERDLFIVVGLAEDGRLTKLNPPVMINDDGKPENFPVDLGIDACRRAFLWHMVIHELVRPVAVPHYHVMQL